MPAAFIEHVNLTVSDARRSAQLMIDLFGWRIRWQGPARDGGSVIHVGDDRSYIAFFSEAAGYPGPWPKGEPLNHVALVVDDLDAIERRVIAAGLTPFSHADYEPGRRFYFFDFDGIEFEMVSYAPVRAAGEMVIEGEFEPVG
jgi:catechol 2,3-dioxygenase-like lactoylglutathione lyase family enzyme